MPIYFVLTMNGCQKMYEARLPDFHSNSPHIRNCITIKEICQVKKQSTLKQAFSKQTYGQIDRDKSTERRTYRQTDGKKKKERKKERKKE